MSSVLKANVENFIPQALQRDLRREIKRQREAGATQLQIKVPLSDFEPMIRDISAQCFRPYVPVFESVAVVPWTGAGVAVMARPKGGPLVLLTIDGREYSHDEVINPTKPEDVELIVPDNHRAFGGS